jgi:hypothetical protein
VRDREEAPEREKLEEDGGGGKTGTAKVVDESERASLAGWHKWMSF